ncbi:MAG: sulfotransferase [Burkholderiales bacterium]|jgi:hypothetical protein|nr:sulfotransferase [Burkholderiales bacterium]
MDTSTPPVSLEHVRDALAPFGPPVMVCNKSHSGSRLLAALLAEGGVFMGAHRNESEDSLDVLELVEHLVGRHYPDYAPLWTDGSDARETARVALECFRRHLEGCGPRGGRPWCWKLCESGYALPLFARLFPGLRVIHLIRDGRDVAFCDHRGPDNAFWRKVHFDTDRIAAWRGMRLDGPAYRRRAHLYNAAHWSNAVRVARAYGAMLGERYLEVRYEDLCRDFAATAARVLAFAGATDAAGAIARVAPRVSAASIGKHRLEPARKVREAVAIAKRELLAFGYLERDPERPRASLLYSSLADRLADPVDRGVLFSSWRRRLRRS